MSQALINLAIMMSPVILMGLAIVVQEIFFKDAQ